MYWRCNEFYGTSVSSSESVCGHVITYHTYRRISSLLFKGTNFCVFCDLEKSAKFTPHAQVAQHYIPCARSERASA